MTYRNYIKQLSDAIKRTHENYMILDKRIENIDIDENEAFVDDYLKAHLDYENSLNKYHQFLTETIKAKIDLDSEIINK